MPSPVTSDRLLRFSILIYALILIFDRQGISELLPGSIYQLFVALRTVGLVLTTVAAYRFLGSTWFWVAAGLLFVTLLFSFTSGELALVIRYLVAIAIALYACGKRLGPHRLGFGFEWAAFHWTSECQE